MNEESNNRSDLDQLPKGPGADQQGNQYFYNNYNYNIQHNELDPHVSMAQTASILSLIGMGLFFTFYFSVILGGIGFIMGLLSRGNRKKFLPQAKKAMIFGAIAVIGSYAFFGYEVHKIVTDPEMNQVFNQTFEKMYGQDFNDFLQDNGIIIEES